MNTPMLDGISKLANISGIAQRLANNPRAGSMVLGGLAGGAVGVVDGDVGIPKGVLLGTAAGYAANKWLEMDPKKMWSALSNLTAKATPV